MSRFFVCAALLTLFAVGCNDQQQNQSQAFYQSPNQTKPVVSIVPVIDHTNNDYAWNLSDELSSSIYQRIAQRDRVIVNKSSQVRHKAKQMKEGQNPFGPDISWMKKIFQGDQFVVFLELVEHEEIPTQKKSTHSQSCSANLNMSMRVRVVDIRENEPKIILQELIHNSHFIPRPFTQTNFFQVSWGDECFSISPIGLAHADFTKEIASRIEDYMMVYPNNLKNCEFDKEVP